MVAGVMFLAWRVQMNGSSTILYTWSIYENEFAHLPSFVSKAMSYAHVHTLYLWKLLWPQYLCYDYGWNTIHAVTSIYDVRNLASSVAYMAVVGAVGTSASHRRTSPLFVLLVLGICPFVPASHVLFPVGTILAERLLYLPSVGFCLVVGYATERVLLAATAATKPKLVALLGLVLAVATSRTIRRNLDWHDEHTLFQSALSVAPTSVKVLTNLGQDILPKDARTAVLYLERAVALMPSYSLGHLNLAAGYAALKKPLQAMHHLVQSIELAYTSLGQHFVEFWESHVGAGQTISTGTYIPGVLLNVLVLHDRAMMNASTFWDCASLVNNAAACFHRANRSMDALKLLDKATKRHPLQVVLWTNAGYMAESVGHQAQALTYFEAALRLEPDLAHLRTKLELAFKQQQP
ncbi:hypothetical protein DYB25_003305 [Aphanomyces astaci]|uniref:dolichyl-phosphate-mannose--protein mannosyltransferase n=1 Tax=Aphanomyces astaci TaxID=112090 RepID=A0A397AKZ5_APHAT|nr:hypothetical protein DYB25_003305 [Aphanomyces astaci]